ncbi:hypothetical protein LZ198_39500 [Myxococcus sp. K15C18031901]|uniref:hypothetical protein n=1 Tax=Myxococcus dinghuensis TaxID=2906761 RepID=UPI0020A78C02|nr:hypothetical protein [Myxococcus dinghuensis]MCP3104969.1 hypothetical protein [Myxococcus dinghuensis]
MSGKAWRWPALLGLGLMVLAGCNERHEQSFKENSREAGRQVGKAAKDLKEGAKESADQVRGAAHEASEGFKEGAGGSGRQEVPPPPPPPEARPHEQQPSGAPGDASH